MTMKNYEVKQEDGTSTHYQFDDSDEVGKASLAALRAAAKDSNNPVTSIEPGNPKPFNASGKGGGA